MTDDEWREKVRELLKAMALVELIRNEKVTRYGWDAHWSRLQAAIERERGIRAEMGI